MFSRSKSKESELIYIVGNYCGVALIDVIMVNEEVLHPQSQWMFTSELRRLIGFKSEKDFSSTASAFFYRCHPEDVEPTLQTVAKALANVGGSSRYEMTFRLRMSDGSYRWFRAMGGFVRDAKGRAVRSSGRLIDVDETKRAAEAAKIRADKLSGMASAFDMEMSSLTQTVSASATRLQTAAQKLTFSAQQTSEQSSNVATAAKKAGTNVSAVAAAAEQLGASIGEISRQVDRSAQMAESAVKEAYESAEIISELSSVAAGIGEVVSLISGLDGQTNLLALNATIEAA